MLCSRSLMVQLLPPISFSTSSLSLTLSPVQCSQPEQPPRKPLLLLLIHFTAQAVSGQDSFPASLWITLPLPWKDRLYAYFRAHVRHQACSDFTCLSPFSGWKGEEQHPCSSLHFFLHILGKTVMPMIFHALAEHGCSRQELYFLNKKGR